MFWDNFYNLCELRKTTPNAVCKELNLSTATATHWKNGTMPKGDALFNIANLLNCSVDYLLGRTDNINGNSNANVNTSNRIELDEMSNELLKRFNQLSFEDKLKAFDYIQTTLNRQN